MARGSSGDEPGTKGDRLRDFLVSLATDPAELGRFVRDPLASMSAAELEPDDQAILRSGDAGSINARITGGPGGQPPVIVLVVDLTPGAAEGEQLVSVRGPAAPLFQLPQILPQVQPQQIFPQVQPQILPQIHPQQIFPQVAPQILPQIHPQQIFPQIAPQILPQIHPQQIFPQIAPQILPQIHPQQIFPQIAPQILPQIHPQQIFPQVLPQIFPQVAPQFVTPLFAQS